MIMNIEKDFFIKPTNINIKKDWKLQKSGLLGPVEIKSN